ncbi:unnamed protein product [Caenorhabditis auriculariae]|uniref:Peroxisomal biogenesis factor 3 n=1 Tax=Caenorhabditis auriculariae TaxID=2777116 RepID=A0A8S1GQA9_9PELO|nr:unnamed protein product [Caenorhabditis auriculariae]
MRLNCCRLTDILSQSRRLFGGLHSVANQMYSTWEFVKRHKGKFIAGGVLLGSAIAFSQQKHPTRLERPHAHTELNIQARKHYIFDSTHQSCDQSITDLIPTITAQIEARFDVEALTGKLQNDPNLSSEEKVRLWETLKIYAFCRIVSVAYGFSILTLALKAQMSVLAADACSQFEANLGKSSKSSSWFSYLPESIRPVVQENDRKPNSSEVAAEVGNRQIFLQCIQYYTLTGVTKLMEQINDAVVTVVSDWSLKDRRTKDEIRQLFYRIEDKVCTKGLIVNLVAPLNQSEGNSLDSVIKLLNKLKLNIDSQRCFVTLRSLVDFYFSAALKMIDGESLPLFNYLPTLSNSYQTLKSTTFDIMNEPTPPDECTKIEEPVPRQPGKKKKAKKTGGSREEMRAPMTICKDEPVPDENEPIFVSKTMVHLEDVFDEKATCMHFLPAQRDNSAVLIVGQIDGTLSFLAVPEENDDEDTDSEADECCFDTDCEESVVAICHGHLFPKYDDYKLHEVLTIFEEGLIMVWSVSGGDHEYLRVESVYEQRLLSNISSACLIDMNQNNHQELIVSMTDRVFRAYRWSQKHGIIVATHKWEVPAQIMGVAIGEVSTTLNGMEIWTSQANAAFFISIPCTGRELPKHREPENFLDSLILPYRCHFLYVTSRYTDQILIIVNGKERIMRTDREVWFLAATVVRMSDFNLIVTLDQMGYISMFGYNENILKDRDSFPLAEIKTRGNALRMVATYSKAIDKLYVAIENSECGVTCYNIEMRYLRDINNYRNSL